VIVVGAVVSPWVALPLAAIALVLIAWHSTGLDERSMPASRRRIRQANAWVMMLGVPLFAIGVSIVSEDRSPRAFVLVWLVTSMLLLVCVLLAVIDALNTWRLASHERRHLAAVHRGMASVKGRRAARSGAGVETRQSGHDD
jgi:hypothetical protein